MDPHRPEPQPAEAGPTLPSRREFAKAALAAAAVPLLGGVAACGSGQPVPVLAPPPSAAPAAPPVADGKPQPERDPFAEALADAVESRYGARLTAAEREKVRESVRGNVRAARALREFDLPIAVEPAFVFRPYRGAGR